jgi:hypothetical protein
MVIAGYYRGRLMKKASEKRLMARLAARELSIAEMKIVAGGQEELIKTHPCVFTCFNEGCAPDCTPD